LRTAFIVALGSGESQTLSEVTTFSVSSG